LIIVFNLIEENGFVIDDGVLFQGS